jgi:hypothetical protein
MLKREGRSDAVFSFAWAAVEDDALLRSRRMEAVRSAESNSVPPSPPSPPHVSPQETEERSHGSHAEGDLRPARR